MNREEIEVKVKEIVAEKAKCEISEVKDQTDLEETLGMVPLAGNRNIQSARLR